MISSLEDRNAAEQLASEMTCSREAMYFLREIEDLDLRSALNLVHTICEKYPQSNLAISRAPKERKL